MAHNRLANKHGTPAEIAGHSEGYVATGESMHTRSVARGKTPLRFATRAPNKTPGYHSLHQLIGECERRIEWIECELKIETRPMRRAKLARDLEIRGKFLTRLLLEAESLR